MFLSTFSSNTTSQLDVFWPDCNAHSMDSAQIGIFKETNQISFAGFLFVASFLVANCLRGALPPVDFLAVWFVAGQIQLM